ncbi:MAG: hypothetical protein PF569_06550 [Candidatus Woesearchaeota archaeon]|jgi:hypothetical protein|nr:hypothetical protein [Candidatus Woesearchaeota archaeon]
MQYNKFAKRLMIFLAFTIIFSIFQTNLSFSAIPSCLEAATISDTIYTFPNNDYNCDAPGNFDFSNLNNFTLDCNGRFLEARTGANINITNSNIIFKDCDIRISGTGTWIENGATNAILNNSIYTTNIFLNTTIGNYYLYEELTFNTQNKFLEEVNGFDVEINSVPQIYQIVKSNLNYSETISPLFETYIGGVQTNYNNFTINVSYTDYLSYNQTSLNISENSVINLILEDNNSPNLISLNPSITNESMSFNPEFSEPVNGTFMILYMNDSIISETIYSDYSTSRLVSASGLIPFTNYKFAYNDVYDRLGNGPIAYPLTIFHTYETINATTNIQDSYTFTGDPQDTTSFNFISSLYNIEIEFLEALNISGIFNFSNEINITSNLIFIDTLSEFNKAARLYFSNLLFETTPVVLKNSSICNIPDCQIESYIGGELIFNVTGFSNYSLTSNSQLNSSYDSPEIGNNFTIYSNYSKTQNNTPILNSSCYMTLNSQTNNMTYNSSLGLYTQEIYTSIIQEYIYNISCYSLYFDSKKLNTNMTTIFQPIDNFIATRTIVKKDGDSFLTEIKNLTVNLTSSGTNNTDLSTDNEYFFMVSKDFPITNPSFTNTDNLTGWVNIFKEESFKIKNIGEDNTVYEFANGTQKNITSFIFTDDGGSSFYINIKSCTFGNSCIYNSTDYYIFLDTTPPEYYLPINVSKNYNSHNKLNFSFFVRDLESGLDLISYGVEKYPNPITPLNQILSFNNNQETYFQDFGHNFEEGKYYRIKLESYNLRLSAQPSYNTSNNFLIDTLPPYNATFNISLYQDNYKNQSLTNLSFNLGDDYHFNYTAKGLNYSGLDYMIISYKNASLIQDVCYTWGSEFVINQTFNSSQNYYMDNLTTGYCYNFSYEVFDKAKNSNISYFEKEVRVDTTIPIINTQLSEDPINRVEKSIFELNNDLVIYTLSWDISDLNSTVDYYDLFIYDNTTNSNVKNFTLNGSNHNSFEMKYNSTYIKDGHTYISTIRARNKAGLYSDNSTTDGVSFYILKIPEVEPQNAVIIQNNPLNNYYQILDSKENGTYILKLNEKNGYNTTCRWDIEDFTYTIAKGTLCSGSNTPSSNCTLNLSQSSNFYISCMNDELVNSYNDIVNNLDVEIISQKNYAPQIESLNSIMNYSNPYTLYENETLNLDLIINDSNTLNYLLLNSTLKIGNLEIKINTTNVINDLISINFHNSSLQTQPNLTIFSYSYDFYFNNTINHSDIISLYSAKSDTLLDITTINLAETISQSSYTSENFSKTHYDGVSNNAQIINISSPYNIILNQSKISWDIENFTIRRDLFNITINLRDDLNTTSYNLTINLTPINYLPQINQTYTNLNNQFNLTKFKVYKYNLTKYFYEENTKVGINEKLSYSYSNEQNIEILNLDKNSGILYLLGKIQDNASIEIIATNIIGKYNSTILNFSINNTPDNLSPNLIISSPINNSIFSTFNKEIFVNVSSNENLSYINLVHNSIVYNLCEGYCNNFKSDFSIFSLVNGTNYLNFTIEDYAGNLNSSLIQINFTLDSDSDAIPNHNDTDSDGDLILDIQDKILWTNTSIKTDINSALFQINDSSNMSVNYTSLEKLEYVDSNNQTYFNFSFDFNTTQLNLLEVLVVYDTNENQYLFVQGLNNISGTKTFFLPKDNINSLVCIRDEEIYSLAQISNTCSDVNEYRLDCSLNESQGNYSCEQETKDSKDYFVIKGLTHSATKLMCKEDWIYSVWSACSNSLQTRTGTDLNNCGTTLFQTLTQSCIIPPTSPSSGGGSSSGGSSSYYPSIIIEENESEIQENITSDNPIILPISLGNVDYGFSKIIEENKLYSFTFEGVIYEGEFSINSENIIFETKENSFIFEFGEFEFDIDFDNENDAVYILEFDGVNYLLDVNPIKKEQITIPTTPVIEPTQDTPIEESKSYLSYILIALTVLTIGGGLAYYLVDKNKHKQEEFDYNSLASTQGAKGFSRNLNDAQSYEKIIDDLLAYSQNLKEEVLSEEDLFNKLHNQAKQLVRQGYSWTDIYYYLKDKKLSNFFIRKVIDFKYLGDKFEDFYQKEDIRVNPQNLRNKLLTQSWFNECYIYDGDGSKILNDILFMFAGANIYGFSKEKFLDVLEDEFKFGLQNTKPIVVEMTKDKLVLADIQVLLNLQKKIENLKQDTHELREEVKTLNISNLNEIEKLIDDLLHSTNKHLDES